MSTGEKTDSATFCQQSGLNEYCLLEILEYLDVYDLMRMRKAYEFCEDLINKWIIGKKLVNLEELSVASRTKILETFGKSTRTVAISEINLNNFLDTVMAYCSPAKLTEVRLYIEQPVVVDLDKIEQSMPYFTNLHKIKLDVVHSEIRHSFNDFFRRLLEVATSLHSLQLHNLDLRGEWFETSQLKNLRELQLIWPFRLCLNKLSDFIPCFPNLETFSLRGVEDVKTIGSTLAKCCPKLKVFADIRLSRPSTDDLHKVGLHRYDFLTSFAQLKDITLTSHTFCGSDLYYLLVSLATKNIQKLRIFVDYCEAVAYSGTDRERIMRSSFADFRSLRELEVHVQKRIEVGELQCDFIIYMARQLKNLEIFSLEGIGFMNINKIIETLSQINKFSISGASFKQYPVEIRKIVRTLRKIRQEAKCDDDRKLVKLVVNIMQWRELPVYKDINNLIEIIIENRKW